MPARFAAALTGCLILSAVPRAALAASQQELDAYFQKHVGDATVETFAVPADELLNLATEAVGSYRDYGDCTFALGGTTSKSLTAINQTCSDRAVMAAVDPIDDGHSRLTVVAYISMVARGGEKQNEHLFMSAVAQQVASAALRQPAPQPSGGLDNQEIQKIVRAAVADATEAQKLASSVTAKTIFHSDVDNPRYHAQARPDDVAVVVGVEKYAGDLPSAEYAERDARAVRAHLLALGFPEQNVILLTGAQASRAGIVKNVERRLPTLVSGDSTVFFYYSGHGAPDPETGKAYLLPFDGDPAYLEDTAYPVERLYRKLGALKAKRVLVALDSCFSGAGGRSVLAKGTRPLVTKISEGTVPPDVIALTASGPRQVAGALDDQGHGAFTYFLLKGLNGAAEDDQGHVTIESLYDYLKPKVEGAARRENRDQTPKLVGGNGAAVVLR